MSVYFSLKIYHFFSQVRERCVFSVRFSEELACISSDYNKSVCNCNLAELTNPNNVREILGKRRKAILDLGTKWSLASNQLRWVDEEVSVASFLLLELRSFP